MSREENGPSDSSRSLKIQLAGAVDLTQIFDSFYKHRNLKVTVWDFWLLREQRDAAKISRFGVLQGRFVLKHKI